MIKNKKLFEIINTLQDAYPLAEVTYFKRQKNNTVDVTVMYKHENCPEFEMCLKSRFHPKKIDVSSIKYTGQETAHTKFEMYAIFTDEYDHMLER